MEERNKKLANTNTVLNTRAQGDSNTTINPANPSGTVGPGNTAQYGGGNSAAEVAANQAGILPAGPGWRIQGSDSGGATNNNIIGTVPPGKSGIPQISTVKQNPTSLVVGNASVGGSVNMADNYLPATTAQIGVVVAPDFAEGNVTPNAAQLASAGKSLAPEHE